LTQRAKTAQRYEEHPNDGRSQCWNIRMIVSAWYTDENGCPTRYTPVYFVYALKEENDETS
jgi:hypothetical protein